MIDIDRLKERMSERGMSQSELARRVGITQGAVAGLISGRSTGSRYLHAIARELGTSTSYLEGLSDDPAEGALPAPTAESVAEQLDSVLVPLYDQNFSMGGGSFFEEVARHELIPIKKNWLRGHLRGRMDQAIMIRGRGDSMKPTIDDGDILFIDTADTVVDEPDLIWAFAYGETGMVKRLRRQPRGGFLVQSDNPVVREFQAADDEVRIVGRMFSIMKWH